MNPNLERKNSQFTKNTYESKDGLTLISVRNSKDELTLSFYSLYAYLLWYFFYRTIDADNKLYTSVYSFMDEHSETLRDMKPVISVRFCLSFHCRFPPSSRNRMCVF